MRKVTKDDEQLDQEWSILETQNGLVDNYLPLLEPFDRQIVWSQSQQHFCLPRPQKGMDDAIDEICRTIDGLKDELTVLLKGLRDATKSNAIVFTHNRKYRH